jgi:ABC-type multidrug transport system ATPase subunit
LILPNLVSFVAQLDNHAPYLTVQETFDFAFQCRTGGTHLNLGVEGDNFVADLDKEKFTENLTIEGLDLAHVANTFVGNDDVRGVSGGQRRRVTVGEMMQGQNPVACADEISTGLDAAVTHDIVHSIVNFAKKAMTTRIISLLQPGTCLLLVHQDRYPALQMPWLIRSSIYLCSKQQVLKQCVSLMKLSCWQRAK